MNIIYIATILHSVTCSFSIFYMELLQLFMVTVTHLQTTGGKVYLNAFSENCNSFIILYKHFCQELSGGMSLGKKFLRDIVMIKVCCWVLRRLCAQFKSGVQPAVAVRRILFFFLD